MAYRFSGHESFPCRYAWLPKAYRALVDDPLALSDDTDAMVALGVGKNMLRSIRFWSLATRIAEANAGGGYHVTPLGREVLDPVNGHDPYLEDVRTLWLLHWNIATLFPDALFAWEFLLNSWHQPELSRSTIIHAFIEEARRQERAVSRSTLELHLDVFLHTYVSGGSHSGLVLEETLDCPLAELGILRVIGERRGDAARSHSHRETVYAFDRGPKPSLTPPLFVYCLTDYWSARYPEEESLTFRQVAMGPGSPGQILKLSEWDLRERLDRLSTDTDGALSYREAADQQRVVRAPDARALPVGTIYEQEPAHAR